MVAKVTAVLAKVSPVCVGEFLYCVQRMQSQ